VLQRLLGCACIFSLGHAEEFGHANTHWFGLTSLHRRENNGIMGSHTYQGRRHRNALDCYCSRLDSLYTIPLLPSQGLGQEDWKGSILLSDWSIYIADIHLR
jgi:hypothetical protein